MFWRVISTGLTACALLAAKHRRGRGIAASARGDTHRRPSCPWCRQTPMIGARGSRTTNASQTESAYSTFALQARMSSEPCLVARKRCCKARTPAASLPASAVDGITTTTMCSLWCGALLVPRSRALVTKRVDLGVGAPAAHLDWNIDTVEGDGAVGTTWAVKRVYGGDQRVGCARCRVVPWRNSDNLFRGSSVDVQHCTYVRTPWLLPACRGHGLNIDSSRVCIQHSVTSSRDPSPASHSTSI